MQPDHYRKAFRWATLLRRACLLPECRDLPEALLTVDAALAMESRQVGPPITREDADAMLAILDQAANDLRNELEQRPRHLMPGEMWRATDVSPDVILEPGPGQGAGTFDSPEATTHAGTPKKPSARDGARKRSKTGGKGKKGRGGKRQKRGLPKGLRFKWRVVTRRHKE